MACPSKGWRVSQPAQRLSIECFEIRGHPTSPFGLRGTGPTSPFGLRGTGYGRYPYSQYDTPRQVVSGIEKLVQLKTNKNVHHILKGRMGDIDSDTDSDPDGIVRNISIMRWLLNYWRRKDIEFSPMQRDSFRRLFL